MATNLSRNTALVAALLATSELLGLRHLGGPAALPPEALAWTVFAAVASLALLPLTWRRRWAFVATGVLAALSALATSFNPGDPYYLTHWDDPVGSLLVVQEGYALPLPLGFFAFRAYRETGRTT